MPRLIPSAHLAPRPPRARGRVRQRAISLSKVNVASLSNLQAKTWEISREIATSLGFSEVGDFSATYRSRVFVIDINVTAPTIYEHKHPESGQTSYAILGIGFRACFAVKQGAATANINLDEIAAKVTAGSVSSRLEVDAYGLLPETDAALRAIGVFRASTFDIAFLEQLALVCRQLSDDIGSRYGEVDVYKLEELEVTPVQSYVLANGISTEYGLHSIRSGRSYMNAMRRLRSRIQSRDTSYDYLSVTDIIVRSVYAQLMPKADPDTKPNSTEIADANNIYVNCRPREP
jgi:hypothetical protein